MVVMDLFPAGILQFNAVVEHGLWYARSSAFVDSATFQTLTWMRIVGGALFTVGGVIPLIVFIVSNRHKMKNVFSSGQDVESVVRKEMDVPV